MLRLFPSAWGLFEKKGEAELHGLLSGKRRSAVSETAEGKEPDARLAALCMGRTRSRRALLFSVFDSVDEVLNGFRHALTSDRAAPSR